MKFVDLLVAFALLALALAFSFAVADGPPLQEFCATTNETNSAVFVNGKFCKDPSLVTADDFWHTGLNVVGNTTNQLGVHVNLITADEMAGLNTLGISLARLDFADGGVNPPHYHPRASELLLVLEGTLYVGFITPNPDHRLFTKILTPGDLFVFPFGLIHFQLNIGNTHAVGIAALTSQNPGVDTVANALFGADKRIDPRILSRAFHLDEKLVESLQNQTWVNPS